MAVLLAATALVAGHRSWLSREVVVSVGLRAPAPVACQVFYTDEPDAGFSEDKSATFFARPRGAEVRAALPVARLERLRFEFGTEPGMIRASPVVVQGAETRTLDWREFTVRHDIGRFEVDARGAVDVESTGGNPYAARPEPLGVRGSVRVDALSVVQIVLFALFVWTLLARLGSRPSALALLCFLVALSFRVWAPKTVAFTATVDAERAFTAQVFYAERDDEGFSSKRVETTSVPAGRTHLIVPIRANAVTKFRFDFGTDAGAFVLSRPRLAGKTTVPLEAAGFGFSRDVETHSADPDGTLRVVSGGGDPYAFYERPLFVESSIRPETLFRLFPLVFLFLLFLWLLSRFAVSVLVGAAASFLRNWKDGVASTDPERRIPSFDFIRIAAFLLVVFSHVLFRGYPIDLPICLRPDSMPWGVLGVSFFIVLSGASLSLGSFDRKESFLRFYLRRIRALLPPFWIAWVVCQLIHFGFNGAMFAGPEPLSMTPTLFGMDAYLGAMVPTYGLVGEWYVGFIAMLYLLAPAIYRQVRRAPAVALPALFILSVSALRLSPALRDFIPFWHTNPRFNVLPHVFEFACGMAFVLFLRCRFRRYAIVALFSLACVAILLSFDGGHRFSFTPCGILVSVAAFVGLCFVLDTIRFGQVFSALLASLGKATYLAFLYHHRIVFLFITPGEKMDNSQLTYYMLLVVVLSYALAWLSMKPAKVLGRLVFGESTGSGTMTETT